MSAAYRVTAGPVRRAVSLGEFPGFVLLVTPYSDGKFIGFCALSTTPGGQPRMCDEPRAAITMPPTREEEWRAFHEAAAELPDATFEPDPLFECKRRWLAATP